MTLGILPSDAKELDFRICRGASHSLNLENTLSSGQVFRWQRNIDGWWSAPIDLSGTVITLRQAGEKIIVRESDFMHASETVDRYFQTHIDVDSLIRQWCDDDPTCEIAIASQQLNGLRVCCQDPVECLFSFLCSSAAPVFRIRRMIENMCRELGNPVTGVFGETLFTFPTIERLAATLRETYDSLGLGYRGGNVQKTALELIGRGGQAYVQSLATESYADAKAALVSLPGVGAKIADCVCLFSLGKHDAVPIDTHMARIAIRTVAPDLEGKSLTSGIYDELSGRFRAKFGNYAGWAQQYLFTAQLHKTGAWDSEAGLHQPGKRLQSPDTNKKPG